MTDGMATATWRRIGNDWVVIVAPEHAALVKVGDTVRVASKNGSVNLVRLMGQFRSGPGYREATYRVATACQAPATTNTRNP